MRGDDPTGNLHQNANALFAPHALYAPLDVRISTIMERYHLDEKGAHSLVRKMDKDRSYYFNYYTDQSWDEMNTYDLSIDTSSFTVDEIVDLLEMVYNKL